MYAIFCYFAMSKLAFKKMTIDLYFEKECIIIIILICFTNYYFV